MDVSIEMHETLRPIPPPAPARPGQEKKRTDLLVPSRFLSWGSKTGQRRAGLGKSRAERALCSCKLADALAWGGCTTF